MRPTTVSTAVSAAVLAGLLLTSCGDTQTPGGEDTQDGRPVTTTDDEESTGVDTEDTEDTNDPEGLDAVVTAAWAQETPAASPYPSTRPTVAIRYSVRNEGAGPVLVATERGHDQEQSSPAPDSPMAVWVSQGHEDDLARLSKQVFDAPDDIDLAAPWRAPAELLEAGAELEGYVVVPVPLQGDLPAARRSLILTEEELTGTPARVEVCIHVVPYVDGAAPDEIVMGMAGGLVCSDPLELPEVGR